MKSKTKKINKLNNQQFAEKYAGKILSWNNINVRVVAYSRVDNFGVLIIPINSSNNDFFTTRSFTIFDINAQGYTAVVLIPRIGHYVRHVAIAELEIETTTFPLHCPMCKIPKLILNDLKYCYKCTAVLKSARAD